MGTNKSIENNSEREFGMETVIGYVLLVGVLLSAVLILAGLALNAVGTGRLEVNYAIKGTNLTGFVAQTVGNLVRGHADARTILDLGICTLLLTPLARVLASVVFFAFEERNLKYTIFTGIVLSILTYSLFLR